MCATPGASFASSINSSITDLDLARIAAQAPFDAVRLAADERGGLQFTLANEGTAA